MQAMNLKYQLPSDPTVYVDLLDDEDVQLMFDEVTFLIMLCNSPNATVALKIFLGTKEAF